MNVTKHSENVTKRSVVTFSNIVNTVVAANITTNRRALSTKKTNKQRHHVPREVTTHGRMEMDSYADTIVLGSNAIILQYTSRECDVSPYADSYEPICDVPIVSGATAVTSSATGETFILVFHEAIWMGDQLDHSLINPNQLRHYGLTVQDNPYASTLLHMASPDDEFRTPMQADGTTIFFDSRTPTNYELDQYPHITLSSRALWNPRDVQFPTAAHQVEEGNTPFEIGSVRTFNLSESTDGEHLSRTIAERLISEVRVLDTERPDVPLPRTFTSDKRHSGVSAEELSERWFIGLSQAHETIKVTTQNCTRSAVLPLSLRYRADRVFEKPLLRGEIYTDTMDGRCKSLKGNKYAQVMANKDFFAVAYPLQSKAGAGDALRQFVNEYGRPEKLTYDGSQEQNGPKTEFMTNVRKYSIDHHTTEPYRPNHNFAEGVIRKVRRKWFRVMVRKNVPQKLWDYGLLWVCDIQNRTSNSSRGLDGRCPLERITGETVDISQYLDFGFYDWVWYRDNAGLGITKIGRWLGVSHRIGTLMSFWILTSTGKVLSRTTVQRVTNLELQLDDNKTKCAAFTTDIAERLGGNDFVPIDEDGEQNIPDDWDDPQFNEVFVEEYGQIINDPQAHGSRCRFHSRRVRRYVPQHGVGAAKTRS